MLWVLDQTRHCLYELNMFYIKQSKNVVGFDPTRKETEYLLGAYDTPERALEVLNELKNFITLQIMEDGVNLNSNSVVKMPQE